VPLYGQSEAPGAAPSIPPQHPNLSSNMASFLRSASRVRPHLSQNITRTSCIRVARLTSPTSTKQATAAAAVAPQEPDASEQPFFPDEPSGPTIRTEIPGPQSIEAIKKLTNVFDTRSLNMMANYQNSYGN
ncbi:hypothetical protein LTS18_000828, partial [Coniosporium uncinatum]